RLLARLCRDLHRHLVHDLRHEMITPAAKYYFGLGIVSLVGTVMYGLSSRAGFTGALSGGLYGSVGEHSGYVVFLGLSAVAFFIGAVVVAFRDADIEASAALYNLEAIPDAT